MGLHMAFAEPRLFSRSGWAGMASSIGHTANNTVPRMGQQLSSADGRAHL